MRFIALLALTFAALVPGCARKESASKSSAGAPSSASGTALLPSSLHGDVAALDFAAARNQLTETARLLEDTLALGAPDCPLAHALRDRVCDLSAHICDLADKDPGAADIRATCQDAGERCERAKERVSTQCP